MSLVKPSPSVATPEGVRACEGVMEGLWASDRSAGATQQVRGCEAEPDDGLINPVTPPFQGEVVTWKLETVQRMRVSRHISLLWNGRVKAMKVGSDSGLWKMSILLVNVCYTISLDPNKSRD